jgi:hypothetical protein
MTIQFATELPRKPESDADEIGMRIDIMAQAFNFQATMFNVFVQTCVAQINLIKKLAQNLDGGVDQPSDVGDIVPSQMKKSRFKFEQEDAATFRDVTAQTFASNSKRAKKAWATRRKKQRGAKKAAK